MSGKNIVVVALVPVALLVPVVLVKLLVKQSDPFLPPELLRHYEVVTAEYYGVNLDAKATPRDVTYVLLRSIEDGSKAAVIPDREQQIDGLRRAREIQLAVAAPQTILNHYLQAGYAVEGEMAEERLILNVVLSWSRMLGYYAGGFGLDHREKWVEVYEPSPSGPPTRALVQLEANKGEFKTGVVVRLARESDRWRVYMVNYGDLPARPVVATTSAPVTRPAPTPEPPSAADKRTEPASTAPSRVEGGPPRTETKPIATSASVPVPPSQPASNPTTTPVVK